MRPTDQYPRSLAAALHAGIAVAVVSMSACGDDRRGNEALEQDTLSILANVAQAMAVSEDRVLVPVCLRAVQDGVILIAEWDPPCQGCTPPPVALVEPNGNVHLMPVALLPVPVLDAAGRDEAVDVRGVDSTEAITIARSSLVEAAAVPDTGMTTVCARDVRTGFLVAVVWDSPRTAGGSVSGALVGVSLTGRAQILGRF